MGDVVAIGAGESPVRPPLVLRRARPVAVGGGMLVVGLAVAGIAAGRWGWFVDTEDLTGVALVNARNGIRDTFLKLSAGCGAIVAALLAWGRLQLSHQQSEREERAAGLAVRVEGGVERGRVIDRHTKAIEQLGSDAITVRLAGLFALQAVAHDSAEHRLAIAEILCSWLRSRAREVPRDQVEGLAPKPTRRDEVADMVGGEDYRTALAIVLRFPAAWGLPRLNLSGIVVMDFSAADVIAEPCDRRFAAVSFANAFFAGRTDLAGVHFEEVSFEQARFAPASLRLDHARFGAEVSFNGAQIMCPASFDDAIFEGPATFRNARFGNVSWFRRARFHDVLDFDRAVLDGYADFSDADLRGPFSINGTTATAEGPVFLTTSFAEEPEWTDTFRPQVTQAQLAEHQRQAR